MSEEQADFLGGAPEGLATLRLVLDGDRITRENGEAVASLVPGALNHFERSRLEFLLLAGEAVSGAGEVVREKVAEVSSLRDDLHDAEASLDSLEAAIRRQGLVPDADELEADLEILRESASGNERRLGLLAAALESAGLPTDPDDLEAFLAEPGRLRKVKKTTEAGTEGGL